MRFPIQPIENKRFVKNRIVDALLDTSTLDLNKIACMEFSDDERMQLAMLLGYSLGGFGDLSYVDDETYYEAERISEPSDANNKQQALQELMEWCEKYDTDIHPLKNGLFINADDFLFVPKGVSIINADTLQAELNRMKQDD
jgi:hypothetical protein